MPVSSRTFHERPSPEWLLPIVLAASVTVAGVSSSPASEAFPGWSGGGSLTGDDAWEEAGIAARPSTAAWPAAFETSAIDLCGGEDTAADTASADEETGPWGCDDGRSDTVAAGCCGAVGQRRSRHYITGILGACFGTLQSGGVNAAGGFPNTGAATDSLLTAGGALGTALDRPNGFLRFEVEGRGRDPLQGRTNSFQPPVPSFFYSVRAVDGWSVMTNAWRDWYPTERFGVYAGGGIGAGGYRLTVDDGVVTGYGHQSGFAWQVGTGATCRITRRTTLDLGYRFFDIGSDSLPLTTAGVPAGGYSSNFYASELLFSVRIYDPFRR